VDKVKRKDITKHKPMIKKINFLLDKSLAGFTLAKFFGAMITITILALVKYFISGNFHIEYCEF
jgi:hypothetical protein